MSNTTKSVLWGFQPFDYRASEAYLEKMAAKGWRLKAIGGYTAEFEAAETASCVYRAAVFESEDAESRKNYIDCWEQAGWEFCCARDAVCYFRKNGQDKELPAGIIVEEERLIKISIWRRELFTILSLLLILAYGYTCQIRISYVSYLTFIEFCKVNLFRIFLIPCGAAILYHPAYYLYRSHTLRRGTSLPLAGVAAAKGRSILLYLPAMLFLLYIVLALALDAVTGYSQTAMLVILMLMVILLSLFMGKNKKEGKKASVFSGVLVALILCITVIGLAAVRSYGGKTELPEGYYALRLAEERPGLSPQRTAYSETASPIVRKHYVYSEVAEDGTAANTEYIECISEKHADLIYDLVLKTLTDVDPASYALSREGTVIIYTEVS